MNKIEEYIKIMDNHNLEKDKSINIDKCPFITPVFLAPLMNFSYNYEKSIKLPSNQEINNYLERVLGLKENTDTTFPLRWLDEKTDNSEELTRDMLRITKPQTEMENTLKYIFHELTNNVYDHSEFNRGFVIGQGILR